MADTKEQKPKAGTPDPEAMPRGEEPKAADAVAAAQAEAPAAPKPKQKDKQKDKQKGKKPGEGKPVAPAEPEGPPPEPAPPPRLHEYYEQRGCSSFWTGSSRSRCRACATSAGCRPTASTAGATTRSASRSR